MECGNIVKQYLKLYDEFTNLMNIISDYKYDIAKKKIYFVKRKVEENPYIRKVERGLYFEELDDLRRILIDVPNVINSYEKIDRLKKMNIRNMLQDLKACFLER